MLLKSSLLERAVTVGDGLPRAGALVVAKAINVTVDDILADIAEMNDTLPEQSRLEKGYITILPASSTMVLSSKGSVVRQKTTELYADEVKAMFKTGQ